MPGLDEPFIILNRQFVCSFVVSSPSMEFEMFLGILLFCSSSNGFVSPSEQRNSVIASWDVLTSDCAL